MSEPLCPHCAALRDKARRVVSDHARLLGLSKADDLFTYIAVTRSLASAVDDLRSALAEQDGA